MSGEPWSPINEEGQRYLAQQQDEAIGGDRSDLNNVAGGSFEAEYDSIEAARKERDALRAQLAEKDKRMFPIQRATPVPWKEAERAYRTYKRLFGNSQTLERLAERGGFGVEEFSCLWHGHEPKADCHNHGYPMDEFDALRAKLAEAERERLTAEAQVVARTNMLNAVSLERDQLAAQLKQLRKYAHEASKYGTFKRLREVLAETPAASLDAHDREVRRKVLTEERHRKFRELAEAGIPTVCIEGKWYMLSHDVSDWLARDLAAQEEPDA